MSSTCKRRRRSTSSAVDLSTARTARCTALLLCLTLLTALLPLPAFAESEEYEEDMYETVGSLKLLARYNDSMQFYDGHVYLLFTSYLDGVTITVPDLYGAYELSEQYYADIRADIANGSNHTGTDTEPYFTFSDTQTSVTLNRGELVTIGMYRGFDLSVTDAALGTVKNSTMYQKLQSLWLLGKAALGAIDGVCALFESGALSAEDAVGELSALGKSKAFTALGKLLRFDLSSLLDGVVEGGVCFNRELYNQKLEWDQYENVTYEVEITREQLKRMEAALAGNLDRFSILKNSCATVALRAWNAAMQDAEGMQLSTESGGMFSFVSSLIDAPKNVRDAMVERFSTWDGFYHNSAAGGDPNAGYPDETGWVYVSAPRRVINYVYADKNTQLDRRRTHLAPLLSAASGGAELPDALEQNVEVAIESTPVPDGVTVERLTFTYNEDGTTVTLDETTPLDGLWLRTCFDSAKDYNAYTVTDEAGEPLEGWFEDGWLIFRATHLPITCRAVGTLDENRIVGKLTIHARPIVMNELVSHAAVTFTTYEDVSLPISYCEYHRPNDAYRALMEEYRDDPCAYDYDPALYDETLDLGDRSSYFDVLSGAVNADPDTLEPVELSRGESCTLSCYSMKDAITTLRAAFDNGSAMADNAAVQRLLAQLEQYQDTGDMNLPAAARDLIVSILSMYAGILQTGSNPANGRVEDSGITVNREIYNQFIRNDSQMPNNNYSVELTAPELLAMVAFLSNPENNYYSLFENNCTTAAVRIWNAALADRPALQLSGNFTGLTVESESLYLELGLRRMMLSLDGVGGKDFYPRTVRSAAVVPELLFYGSDYATITCRDEDWNSITNQHYTIAPAGEAPDWSKARRLMDYDSSGFYYLDFEGLEPYTSYTIYARLRDAYRSAPSNTVQLSFTTEPIIDVEGVPCVGGTLTVAVRPESLDPDIQWCYYDETDYSEESIVPIEGANGTTYHVTEDELGKCLCVFFSKDGEVLYNSYLGPVDYGAPAPTLPESTEFTGSMRVAITAAEDTSVYYTTDGSYPGWYGTEYTEPFTITGTTTVKAVALPDDWDAVRYESPVVSATYTLAAPSPVIDDTSGNDSHYDYGYDDDDDDGTPANVIIRDTDGTLRSADLTLSDAALKKAEASGGAIPLLSNVPVGSSVSGKLPPIRVTLPNAASGTSLASLPRVALGVNAAGSGVVASVRQADGSLRVVKDCRIEGDTLIVPVSGSCELVVADNSKRFADVEPFRWYADYVAFVSAREIFSGTPNGFEPNAQMTRAMVAQMLYNFDRSSKPGKVGAFRDVEAGRWFADAVSWASEQGIVMGSGGLFRAGDPITRQEIVTILYRYAKYAGYDVSGDGDLSGKKDADSVSAYAREAMSWALRLGVIEGIDGALEPRSTATRAQVAAIMTRFVQLMGTALAER